MNELVQNLTWKYIFNPPSRPSPEQYPMKSKRDTVLRSITGDEIHIRLICPYGSTSTIEHHIQTEQIVLFCHGNSDDINSCNSYGQWLADTL